MNRKNQGKTIKDLETNDVKNEFDVDEETIEVNEENIGIMESQSILKIVTDVKNYQEKKIDVNTKYKVICGEKPYNKNAVINNPLYKNGLAFIVDPTNFTVPCSLLRVYSLLFQSTDKAVSLIRELVKQNVSHKQFAEYLFYVHKIKLINCFNLYYANKTNLNSTDFNDVDEILCIGETAYTVLVKGGVFPHSIKTGQIIHPSGLVHNSDDYFKTWYLYQDSCIRNNNGISLKDFKVF